MNEAAATADRALIAAYRADHLAQIIGDYICAKVTNLRVEGLIGKSACLGLAERVRQHFVAQEW